MVSSYFDLTSLLSEEHSIGLIYPILVEYYCSNLLALCKGVSGVLSEMTSLNYSYAGPLNKFCI